MIWNELPADFQGFIIAAIGGLVLATITRLFCVQSVFTWPMRLYLWLFKHAQGLPALRRYGGSRTTAKFRELFVVSWFVWFFILFSALVVFHL